MTLIVQGLTSHDLYGTDSCQKTICGGEVSQELDIFKCYFDSQNDRQPHEGYTVSGGPALFLY